VALGETIIALLFNSTNSIPQLSHLESALGLTLAYGLKWIYFDVEASRHYKHALRRNFFTGLLFPNIHIFLHMAIVASNFSFLGHSWKGT